jgi:hypothetical protein
LVGVVALEFGDVLVELGDLFLDVLHFGIEVGLSFGEFSGICGLIVARSEFVDLFEGGLVGGYEGEGDESEKDEAGFHVIQIN